MRKLIHVGEKAPVIERTDIWGDLLSVPDNGKWFYLSFHRFAACPFCNLRTNELIRNYERFQKSKIEIVSLWPSSKENLLQFAGDERTPFPLLSDQSRQIYRAYGVTESSFAGAFRLLLHPKLIFNAIKNKRDGIAFDADQNLMPASFLINPQGIVKMAHYGKHFGDHPEIQTILNHVQ